MEQYQIEEKQNFAQLKVKNLKSMIGAILDGKYKQAVKEWNYLKINPVIKDIKLVQEEDAIVVTTQNNDKETIKIDDILQEVSRLST